MRPRLNDCSRVSGTDECPNWTSGGNDRSGELDGNSWLASNVGSRCTPVSDFPAANVSNADGTPSIELPLFGTLIWKFSRVTTLSVESTRFWSSPSASLVEFAATQLTFGYCNQCRIFAHCRCGLNEEGENTGNSISA